MFFYCDPFLLCNFVKDTLLTLHHLQVRYNHDRSQPFTLFYLQWWRNLQCATKALPQVCFLLLAHYGDPVNLVQSALLETKGWFLSLSVKNMTRINIEEERNTQAFSSPFALLTLCSWICSSCIHFIEIEPLWSLVAKRQFSLQCGQLCKAITFD